MAEVTLKANRRTSTHRSKLKDLRNEGKIPGIYYLRNGENLTIQVETLALRPIVYTAEAHVINLMLDGDTERKCILRDVQFDPVTDRIVHFDLMGLTADQTIRMEVPVVLNGTSIGVKEGGIVQHALHRIEVECLPGDLPEHITVDISNLHIGDSVKVQDISIPGVKLMLAGEQQLVSVTHPKVVSETPAAAEATEGEAAAEPEVITKGKKEED